MVATANPECDGKQISCPVAIILVSVRHAPEPAKRHDKSNDGNDEQKRFAGHREQNSCADHGGHQQVNQNCQRKLHTCDYNCSYSNCKDVSHLRRSRGDEALNKILLLVILLLVFLKCSRPFPVSWREQMHYLPINFI